MSKDFSLRQVLTALTGKLFCTVDELYSVMNYLTSDSLYTHQLPRAFRACQPFVAEQHPDLAALDWSSVNRDTWREWVEQQERQFGLIRALQPVGAYKSQHPLDELSDMLGGDLSQVIVVDIERGARKA